MSVVIIKISCQQRWQSMSQRSQVQVHKLLCWKSANLDLESCVYWHLISRPAVVLVVEADALDAFPLLVHQEKSQTNLQVADPILDF